MKNRTENALNQSSQSFFAKAPLSPAISQEEQVEMMQSIIDAGIDAYIAFHQKLAFDNAVIEGIAIPRKLYQNVDNSFQEKFNFYKVQFLDFHLRFDTFFDPTIPYEQLSKDYFQLRHEHLPDAKTFEMTLLKYFEKKFNYSSLGHSNQKTML